MVAQQAREAAAAYLHALGKSADAEIALRGGGDDFPEVAIAFALARHMRADRQRLERALQAYADTDFWDAEIVEASPAYQDQGLIARAALTGRDLFQLHRD